LSREVEEEVVDVGNADEGDADADAQGDDGG
jgi:hypothetical protein